MAGPWCLVAANDWLTGAMPPLMFPVVADLGRGRVADKEMPSGATRPESPPRPQVRSRAAGQIKEGRAVRCHAMAMSRRPSRHTLDGAMVRVRVLDADMTAVALRDPRTRKRVRPVESHPPSDPGGILRAANPGAREPSMANALAGHCQTSGRLLPAGELGWCARVPFSRAGQTRMGEASLGLSDGLSGVSREQLLGSSPAAADLDFDAGGHQGGQEGRRAGDQEGGPLFVVLEGENGKGLAACCARAWPCLADKLRRPAPLLVRSCGGRCWFGAVVKS